MLAFDGQSFMALLKFWVISLECKFCLCSVTLQLKVCRILGRQLQVATHALHGGTRVSVGFLQGQAADLIPRNIEKAFCLPGTNP